MMQVRAATDDDTDELIRLAGLMFESIGVDASADDWRERARSRLAAGFADGTVAGFVVAHPDRSETLVSAAMASISQRLPTPTNPAGLVAYVQWVATEPEFRRRGAAREVMDAIVQWARDRDLAFVDLHASPHGERLYRSMGFKENANPELRLRLNG